MIRRPPRSTQSRSSAASDVYKRQITMRNATRNRTAGCAFFCAIRPSTSLRQYIGRAFADKRAEADVSRRRRARRADPRAGRESRRPGPVSYTHLRAHETRHDLVCRLLLEKKKNTREKKKMS